MTINCRFKYGQKVKHKYNEFEGFVISIHVKLSHIEYEVLPVTDAYANWRESIWIDEVLLDIINY